MSEARGTVIVSEQESAAQVGWHDGPDYGPGLDVLRLAADCGLTELVPRMRFDVTGRSSRVMEVVEGTPASAHRTGGVLDPTVAAALGGALGGWHSATASATDGSRPAMVTVPAPALVHDPLLRAALAAAAVAWRPAAVVHGDCRARNAAIVDPPSCGTPSVILTGWGRSGAGDPAWDLGCLVADLVGPGRGDHDPGPTTATLVEPSVAAAVVAYGRAAGPVDADLARRAALFAVARLVADALEDDRRAGLAAARSIASSIDAWTARLAGWLR